MSRMRFVTRLIIITVSTILSVLIILTVYLAVFQTTISPLFSIFLNRTFQYSNHPNAQPMTCWESIKVDPPISELSLQILDDNNGILVYKDFHAEKTYRVEFIPGAYMVVYDDNLVDSNTDENGRVADYVMVAYSNTVCKMSAGHKEMDLPETIWFQRTNVESDE